MSREGLESLLIEVRNGVHLNIAELALEENADAVMADQRAVWHATEIALGILRPGKYLPKREAMDDVRSMLAWYDDENDEWTTRD
jgi:hypothetical protein